jgi:hypothetical protein
MANSETQSLTQTGLVEVSGWDEDEVCFVERSELAWDECAGRLNSSSTRNRGRSTPSTVLPCAYGFRLYFTPYIARP